MIYFEALFGGPLRVFESIPALLCNTNAFSGDSFNTCSVSCQMIEDQLMLEMENLAQRLIESVSMRSSTVIQTDDFGEFS